MTGFLLPMCRKMLVPEQSLSKSRDDGHQGCFSISLAQGKHLFILVMKPHRKNKNGDDITINLINQPIFMVYPPRPRS